MKNASVAGCQIFPIPPLPEGNHLRGKCVTRVLTPRAPCQMISMMSTDFFKYVISSQSTELVTKMTKDIEITLTFPGKSKSELFLHLTFKELFYVSD